MTVMCEPTAVLVRVLVEIRPGPAGRAEVSLEPIVCNRDVDHSRSATKSAPGGAPCPPRDHEPADHPLRRECQSNGAEVGAGAAARVMLGCRAAVAARRHR